MLIRRRTSRSLTRTDRHRSPSGLRAVCLHPLGGRRPETRYIWFVIFRQRVSAGRYGVPHFGGPLTPVDQKRPVDRQGLKHSTAADDLLRSDPFTITKDYAPGPASIADCDLAGGAQRQEGGGW